MRIVFMGATELGWNCCRTLQEIGQEVVGIFSIPQEFRISWSAQPVTNVQYKCFEDLAAAHSTPLIYVTGKMSDPEYGRALSELQPDVIIVVGWYYMLPASLRKLAPLGAAGLHASLLPRYRGGAPLVWATINGDTETGVTFFHFADGVDDGDIIGQARFNIDFADDIADLVHKASQVSVKLISEYVPLLAQGAEPRVPQDHGQATFVSQRKPEDGIINWNALSSKQAYDWVRAQTRPYPGAFTFLEQERVTIWKAALDNGSDVASGPAGSVVIGPSLEGFGVRCADGRLVIVNEIGLEDGSVMTGKEFAALRSLKSGVEFDIDAIAAS